VVGSCQRDKELIVSRGVGRLRTLGRIGQAVCVTPRCEPALAVAVVEIDAKGCVPVRRPAFRVGLSGEVVLAPGVGARLLGGDRAPCWRGFPVLCGLVGEVVEGRGRARWVRRILRLAGASNDRAAAESDIATTLFPPGSSDLWARFEVGWFVGRRASPGASGSYMWVGGCGSVFLL